MKPPLLFAALVLGAAVRGDAGAFRGREELLRIENDALELEVEPGIGRIVHLSRRGGENLLTRGGDRAGIPAAGEDGDFVNHGGDWLWPVHQDHWERMGGPRWPPPGMLEQVWTGEKTLREDGVWQITLRAFFGAPVHVEVERRILLGHGEVTEFRVEQSLRRVAASDVPVLLWQISQVASAENIWMDRHPRSRFPDGHRRISFGRPTPNALTAGRDAIHYRTGVEPHTKLGADGDWIAARRGRDVLLLQAQSLQEGGEYPDGGCRITLYSCPDRGYTEIETQSAAHPLPPGGTISNLVTYRILDVGADVPDSCVPAQIRRVSGASLHPNNPPNP